MVRGMKRVAPWTMLAVLVLVIVAPLAFAAATAQPAGATRSDKSPGAPIATALSTITGVAISPLLGTGAYGMYQWIKAEDGTRAKLPWYAQPSFWIPALLLVAACAAKDAFGATVPTGMKKPLDVLETIENKFSGLIAAGAVVPFAIDTMAKLFFDDAAKTVALAGGEAGVSGLAMVQLAAIDLTWLVNILTVPFGIAVFLLVWLASHAINVLILLSPWGAIDGALKAARTGLLGLVTISATMNPWIGAALSVVVIVISYLVAGWSFRLMVFGGVFCWEFVTRRCGRFVPSENMAEGNKMFAGASFASVPVRTYGRLRKAGVNAGADASGMAAGGAVKGTGEGEARLEFEYRPWLVGQPQVVALDLDPRDLAVGEGVLFSDVVDAEDRTLFSLPPRYRGHEAAVARAYALGGGVKPAGLRKAWGALREMLGGRALKKEPLAA